LGILLEWFVWIVSIVIQGIEQIGILIHSSNRVNGINQAAEVVSKVGAEKEEKEANGRLGPPPKR
jgi:hypothetical protein